MDWLDILEIRNWVVEKIAGKLLVVTGVLGLVVNVFYDKLVTRPVIEYGSYQRWAFVYFGVCIVIGCWWEGYIRDRRDD